MDGNGTGLPSFLPVWPCQVVGGLRVARSGMTFHEDQVPAGHRRLTYGGRKGPFLLSQTFHDWSNVG